MTVHVVVSLQMDFDGIADRVIHYCQDNSISYKSSIPDSAFTDADGLDDVKLVTAFNAADTPTINPGTPLPGDAVTGSGSGLDPHISPENAILQAQRWRTLRKLPKEKVLELIKQHTDQPSLAPWRSGRERADAQHRDGQARPATRSGGDVQPLPLRRWPLLPLRPPFLQNNRRKPKLVPPCFGSGNSALWGA